MSVSKEMSREERDRRREGGGRERKGGKGGGRRNKYTPVSNGSETSIASRNVQVSKLALAVNSFVGSQRESVNSSDKKKMKKIIETKKRRKRNQLQTKKNTKRCNEDFEKMQVLWLFRSMSLLSHTHHIPHNSATFL